MKLKLQFSLDNAAFDEIPEGVAADVLRQVANRLETSDKIQGFKYVIKDFNGNSIGTAEVLEEEPRTFLYYQSQSMGCNTVEIFQLKDGKPETFVECVEIKFRTLRHAVLMTLEEKGAIGPRVNAPSGAMTWPDMRGVQIHEL